MKFGRVAHIALGAWAALSAATAEAQILNYGGPNASRWFVDGHVGASWPDYDSFKIDGAKVGTSTSETSLTASAGLGLYFSNQVFARISYRYFGGVDASGSLAGTPASLDVDAHGALFGLGFNLDLSRDLFVEATAEIGAAFIDASRVRVNGVSVGTHSDTNLAYGLGLGLGYRLNRSTDLLVSGTYHWLGDAATNLGGSALKAEDLGVAAVTVGARIKF